MEILTIGMDCLGAFFHSLTSRIQELSVFACADAEQTAFPDVLRSMVAQSINCVVPSRLGTFGSLCCLPRPKGKPLIL
jgi:hypothetical protein